MSRVSVHVNGTPRPIHAGSLNVTLVANGLGRVTCEFIESDASWRPSMDDDIIVVKDAVNLFGGSLNALPEAGVGGEPIVPISTKVSGNDYGVLANRRFVNETIPAGNLKAALVVLTTYLASYGVALDAGQVNGPSIPELVLTYVKVTDVLNQLTTLSGGYIWKIDASRVLSMSLPGSNPCPFNVTDGDGNTTGDVEVEPTRNDFYANKIIGILPPVTKLAYDETFTGDGVTATFALSLVAKDPANFRGYVSNNGVAETLGTVGANWLWDFSVSPQTITRVVVGTSTPDPPANTNTIVINYDGVLTGVFTASDPTEIAAHGLWEAVIQLNADVTPTLAQQIVDEELARRKILQKLVHYSTYTPGAFPGMSQTIVCAKRNINASFLIQEVQIVDQDSASGDLLYHVTALENNLFQPTWQATVKQWSQTGGGSSIAPTATSGAVPGEPVDSLQKNEAGKFGGTNLRYITPKADADGIFELYGDAYASVFRYTSPVGEYPDPHISTSHARYALVEELNADVSGLTTKYATAKLTNVLGLGINADTVEAFGTEYQLSLFGDDSNADLEVATVKINSPGGSAPKYASLRVDGRSVVGDRDASQVDTAWPVQTILNADVLTLPSTPINVYSKPGTNRVIVAFRIAVRFKIVTAYTNIDAGAYLSIAWDSGGDAGYIGNDATATPALTQVSDLLGTTGDRFVVLEVQKQTVDPATLLWGAIPQVFNASLADQGLILKLVNPAGDLTGGSSSNRCDVNVIDVAIVGLIP